jgi:hypothetical protein
MMTISGSFTADGTHATMEVQATGIINIFSDWSGSWTWGTYSGDNWKTIVTAGAGDNGFRLDGEIIDAETFNANFQVTNDGKTLSLIKRKAHSPNTKMDQVDVPRDGAVLSWSTGKYADQHDVYFGTNFDDVNNATVNSAEYMIRQSETIYTLGRLDLEHTYYWRIDEVNAPPDSTIFKGDVWSFTTEPVAYAVPAGSITVTASSADADQGPENIVNESGLIDDLHSNELTDMWLTAPDAEGPAWIQFGFDRVLKLHEMWVWNHNSLMELALGLGCKDVTIEYSVDGTDFTILGATHEFTQAPGSASYAANTTIDFSGAAAKYVKLTINSNWKSILEQYGLSEVRFLSIPVYAREPNPIPGATDVSVDVTLDWRAGRDAAEHIVYLSTDEQAVIDGTADAVTLTESSLTTSIDLGGTYYWRIDEVNDAETPAIWPSDIWSFSTLEFLVVDDFEAYNDIPESEEGSNLVYLTWIDGYVDPPAVRTNGSTVGYTIPYEPTMESVIVHSGEQSMPFFYSNTGGVTYSEAERTFATPQDWTKAGIQTLTLYVGADSLSGALDTTFSFTKDGDADWFSQATNFYYDEDAAQSGDISDNQDLSIQTTVSGAGTVSFYWKVSSEADWDFLEFYIDGELQDQISGEVDWQQMTYAITGSGSHTLEWRYFKDAGASGGEDCGWVDKLEWTGAGQPAEMPGNTGQLYAKVNGVKVVYPGDVADITWRKWSIDLGSLGVDLQAVRTLAVGIDGIDASGTLSKQLLALQSDVLGLGLACNGEQ